MQAKGPRTQTFWCVYLLVGWRSSHEEGGTKRFGMSLEISRQVFGRISRDFTGISPGPPEKVSVQSLAPYTREQKRHTKGIIQSFPNPLGIDHMSQQKGPSLSVKLTTRHHQVGRPWFFPPDVQQDTLDS